MWPCTKVQFDIEHTKVGPVNIHLPVGLQLGIFAIVAMTAVTLLNVMVGSVGFGPENIDLTAVPLPAVIN